MIANRDETQGAVKGILQQSHAPKPLSQIRKELAGSFRVSSKDLSTLLDEMTAASEIFSWPQKKFWDRDPGRVLPDLILAFMTKSTVATASKIKTSLKLPMGMVETALRELAEAGRLFIWQPGKTAFSASLTPARRHCRLS